MELDSYQRTTSGAFCGRKDLPVKLSNSIRMAKFLLDQLQHRGLVDFGKFTGVWRVSAGGFERLEEIRRGNPTNSDRAFVAMG